MTVIINSGPLITLAKLGLIDLLPRLYGDVILPTAVFVEAVVRGRERGYSDASLIQLAIRRAVSPDLSPKHENQGKQRD